MAHSVTGLSQVFGVSLGVYSPEEVRKLSVCEVCLPATLDPVTAAPTPGGLYDLRMGPSDATSFARCETCKQSYHRCPGHFGRLELAVPLYHPLFMQFTTQLLNLTCHNCFRFKSNAETVRKYAMAIGALRHRTRANGGGGGGVGTGASASSSDAAERYELKLKI